MFKITMGIKQWSAGALIILATALLLPATQSYAAGAPMAPTNLTGDTFSREATFTWTGSFDATSYNIYRDNVLIDSTSATSYNDLSTGVQENQSNTFYYRVTAVADGLESGFSNYLGINVSKVKPYLSSAVVSSTPPKYGWYYTEPTINYYCDNTQNICDSVTITTETAGQNFSYTYTNEAGNSTTITDYLKFDKTAPLMQTSTLNPSVVIRNNDVITVTGTANDNISGVIAGEFYIDSDPGYPGSAYATQMWPSANGSNTVSGQKTISGLTNGTHTVYIRVRNLADLWSTTQAITFTYKK